MVAAVQVTFICCLVPFFGDESLCRTQTPLCPSTGVKSCTERMINNGTDAFFVAQHILWRSVERSVTSCKAATCCQEPMTGDSPITASHIFALGAGFTPIDFILPVMLWNKAKNPALLQRLFHYLIIVVYGGVGTVGTLSKKAWQLKAHGYPLMVALRARNVVCIICVRNVLFHRRCGCYLLHPAACFSIQRTILLSSQLRKVCCPIPSSALLPLQVFANL